LNGFLGDSFCNSCLLPLTACKKQYEVYWWVGSNCKLLAEVNEVGLDARALLFVNVGEEVRRLP
jgi:hypothetical protein